MVEEWGDTPWKQSAKANFKLIKEILLLNNVKWGSGVHWQQIWLTASSVVPKWELGMGVRTEDNPWLSENMWWRVWRFPTSGHNWWEQERGFLHSRLNHMGLIFWLLKLGLSCGGSYQLWMRTLLCSVSWTKHAPLWGLMCCSAVVTAPPSPLSTATHFWGFDASRDKWLYAVVWMALGWWGCNRATNQGQSLLQKRIAVFCGLTGWHPLTWVIVMQKNAVIWLRNYLGMLGSNEAAYKSSWRAPSPGKFRLLLSSDFPLKFPWGAFWGPALLVQKPKH